MAAPANIILQKIQIKRWGIVSAIVTLLLFIITSILVISENTSFDYRMLSLSSAWEANRFTRLIKAITFLGNHRFLIPANLLLILFLFQRNEKRFAGLVLFTALSSLGWKYFLKELFDRPRPVEAMIKGIKNFSFPSGHALMSITFFGLLILLSFYFIQSKKLRKLTIIVLLLLIILIGFSRIYLRVHYTSDVIGGYAFGYSWLVFCLWLFVKPKVYMKRDAL